MKVQQEFVYSSTNDTAPVLSLHAWIKTLSNAEQREFQLAETRQFGLRQVAVRQGNLEVDPVNNSYIWKDEHTAQQGKGHDEIWLQFWFRYLEECSVKFEIVTKPTQNSL